MPNNEDHLRDALTRRAFLDRGSRLAVSLGLVGASGIVPDAPTVPDGPDAHHVGVDANELALGNEHLRATWSVADGALRPVRLVAADGRVPLPFSRQAFVLGFSDRTTLAADAMRVVGEPRVETIAPDPRASRLAERVPGRRVVVTLRDADGRLEAEWRGVLRDGSRYLRQELTLRALAADVPLRDVTLLDFESPTAWVSGTVRGSPVVAATAGGGAAYFGVEHPLADNTRDGDRVLGRLRRTLPLRPATTLDVSAVVGVARRGQLRRDFLAYVERERAHPYRTFLHPNTWYDIGYFSRYDEAAALAAITAFGTELHERRGVTLDSYLFDDGWDDPATLWRFHAGFPDGFTRVAEATRRYGAAPGVWLSPWGGYGQPKQERLTHGRAQGFETNASGFALSGPVYYQRFRDACMEMIRRYGVNQFKFDGTGNAASTAPGSPFDSDFDAAIHLIGELRAEKPDLYVNLTTGTYPSPFWLRYADSIWRGGEDHDFAGVGTSRERWITYRDADTYEHVVRAGELFPMNSLMLHGLIYARSAHNLTADPGGDFSSEVRSYFGTGTQLQEMYVTPSLLTSANWDALAEGARWARANADTLVDTHWVGGDPLRREPYGWASWSPRKGILTLRNPSDAPQTMAVDVARVFELPPDAPRQYVARSPWRADAGGAPVRLRAGAEHVVRLAPFEVLTLEAVAG